MSKKVKPAKKTLVTTEYRQHSGVQGAILGLYFENVLVPNMGHGGLVGKLWVRRCQKKVKSGEKNVGHNWI